jgi:septal ring factor EnvC (AmiA/AmiB activator)
VSPESVILSFFAASRRFTTRAHRTWATEGVALASVLLLSVPGGPAGAAAQQPNTQQREAQLAQLRAKIQHLQIKLNETVGKRDRERERLHELEIMIGSLVSDLRQIGQRLQAETVQLRLLERQRVSTEAALGRQKRGLELQARAAYVLGQQEYLKLLLNQQDPQAVSRVLTYYSYLQQARVQQIADARDTLARLQTTKNDITAHTRELADLQESQTQRKHTLEAARTQRAQVLASLDQKVHDQSAEITRLREDERRLQRLIEDLQDYLADVPAAVDTRFRDAKGRLPLPVRGPVLVQFGDPAPIGGLRSKGIFVGGQEGQDVRAVARGRVAFADWLRGFGLLLILDHGDGYMTLYGHNQSLYVQLGDWVEAGQVIASVGNTGDTPRPGVYFEIRQRGEPRDPLQWCRAR